jgi:hypothetical protein
MPALPHHRPVPLQRGLRLAALLALVGATLLPCACQYEDAAQGSARAIDRSTYALTDGDLLSLNGTYGAACRDRVGGWSLPFTEDAILDHPTLSVLVNDTACALTLTALRSTQGLLTATPPILLTAAFQAAPSQFGSPLDFYANAKLSSVAFAQDFVLTFLYSDVPNLATGHNTAIAIPPTVVAHTPAADATEVSIAIRPTVTFDVPMDPATITALTFTLHQGLTPIDATVTFDAPTRTATLTPWGPLDLDLPYQARVTVGARDTGDTPLAQEFLWTFTTALCSQGRVELGDASSFAVLAASTATNTGPTVVTGDLGVSPGNAVTGFPPGQITGTYHLADATADAASAALVDAYTDAAARAVCPVPVSGDLGGQTLTPGLYRSGSSLALTSGDLTLDGLGEADAVFVFQVGSTLSVGSGLRLNLTNGASSANVYWQVGSSATLGTGCDFAGTILAFQSITLETGAALTGRALALNAAVTMDSNTVGEPAP